MVSVHHTALSIPQLSTAPTILAGGMVAIRATTQARPRQAVMAAVTVEILPAAALQVEVRTTHRREHQAPILPVEWDGRRG